MIKKIAHALFLVLVLLSSGCFSRPWVHHGGVQVFVPPLWGVSHRDSPDSMMVSMAETTAYVSIAKVSGVEAYQNEVESTTKMKRDLYPKERIKTEALTSLGGLHGIGVKFTEMNEYNPKEIRGEEIYFLSNHDGRKWMISAGCESGSNMTWFSYRRAINSLTLKK